MKNVMSSPEDTSPAYSRRQALLAVGKYSVALSGAAVVALSAEEAAAAIVCRDYSIDELDELGRRRRRRVIRKCFDV